MLASMVCALRTLPLVLLCSCSADPVPGEASQEAVGWTETDEWRELKAEIRRRYPDVPAIGVEELAELEGGAVPRLLDARAPEEYAVSHLPNAELTPDLDAALRVLADTPRDAPLVVYCSVGYRSADLTQRLRMEGFTNVRNLEGSIFEWRNRGLPVQRGDEVVEVVHPFDQEWGRLLEPRYWSFGER